MIMKKIQFILFAGFFLVFISPVHAFDITPRAVTGGGGTSTNGSFSVFGSMEGVGGVLAGASTVENGFIPQLLADRTAYEAFLEDNFDAADRNNPGLEATVWGPTANPDGDNHDNLGEYAHGLNPNDGGDAEEGVSSQIVTDGNNNKYLEITYIRRTDDPNLLFDTEVSGDNQSWNSGGGFTQEVNVVSIDVNFEEVTVQDQIAIAHGGPRLGRVTAEQTDLPGSPQSVSDKHAGTVKTIAGNGGSGNPLTLLASQVVQPQRYGGIVSSVGIGTVTDTNSTWNNGEFDGGNGLHYVEFDSGLTVDIVATDSGTNTLTLEGDVTGLVGPGDGFSIHKHFTIDEILGANDEAGLEPGPNASAADNVFVHVPETQTTHTLFYSNVVGFEGWYFADAVTPAGDLVVPPAHGMIVRRKVAGDTAVCVAGVMKEGPKQLAIYEGFNIVSTMKLVTDLELSQTNLDTFNSATGVQPGPNPSSDPDNTDNLLFLNPDGSLDRHFLSNFPGFTGWFTSTFVAADDTVIPANQPFYVLRRTGNGTMNWSIPGE